MKKIAIITGASGNLGRAVVNKFLDQDYHVIGTVIAKDPVPLDIKNQHFEKVEVDLGSEKDAENLFNQIISDHGVIDAAVFTVGGFAMGTIAETRIADINKQYKLNFETAYNSARPVFLQMMKQKNGRIFLIGSRPGLEAKSGKGMIAYSLAKSLIFRLAELMNEEAKGTNVVVCVIVPSTIDTPQNRQSMPDSDSTKWVKAEDIAEIIYFYCTPRAAVIRESMIKVYNFS
jgi:NAD(P)-dependent dehydrogenase (short-subunit alcohol dehydrogenase family)